MWDRRMKIFISYPANDVEDARLIASALQARGYSVFIDRKNLGPGQSYDGKIEQAVDASDLFIFLLSPEAIEAGRYTMSELGYAQQRWPNPDRYVLPVLIRAVDLNLVPDYLRAVTFLRPAGNLAAEVGAAVDRMLARDVALSIAKRFAVYGAYAGAAASFLAYQSQVSLIDVSIFDIAPDFSVPIGFAFMVSLRRSFQSIEYWRTLICFGLIVVASLFAPQILWLYRGDMLLYPDHFLSFLYSMQKAQESAGYTNVAHYLSQLVEAGLDFLRKQELQPFSGSVPIPRTYVRVPISIIVGYGAVSSAFILAMIAGLSLIFLRLPRLIQAIAVILFAFVIGAVSALALGLYQSSVIIVWDIPGDIAKSLWSYPGLIIAATVWTTLIFGVLGYGLANTLPNRPQRSIERAY
jgi:hypothetical protein